MIKKDEKVLSQRDRLKLKMKKMNPLFRENLRQEIKTFNKPTTSLKAGK